MPLNRATSRPGLIGRNRSQVRAIGVMRGSTTMISRPVLARLPDVVGGDRRAFGDVGAADPDHLGVEDVGHGLAARSMPNAFLLAAAGADHAQPAVVVDVRRLQAHAGELAHQVGLLGRQARAAEHGEGVGAVLRLDALRSPRRRGAIAVVVGHRRESRRARTGRARRREQPVGVRALQVALDALGAEHAAVEREILPRLEADDLVVLAP